MKTFHKSPRTQARGFSGEISNCTAACFTSYYDNKHPGRMRPGLRGRLHEAVPLEGATLAPKNGQALIESTVIIMIILGLLLGGYAVGKIIITKENNSILNRNIAFKDTYTVKSHDPVNSSSDTKNEFNAQFKFIKEKSGGDNFGGPIGKILNFISKTKNSKVEGNLDIEKHFARFIEKIGEKAQVKDELKMDEDTFSNSKKLKLLLWGVALVKSGFSKETDVPSIGKDLLDSTKDFNDKENIYFE